MDDRDRKIEMTMCFFASWKDQRISQKNYSRERVNLNIFKGDVREKIFVPDLYVYNLVELEKTKMFFGTSELFHLYTDSKLM